MRPEKEDTITVFVEGNLSSGKTTLVEKMKILPEVEAIVEPVETWRQFADANLYALFSSDRARWGFTFQSYVQLTMADIHIRPSSSAVKVMERSIHSGRHVFIENLRRTGQMTAAEYAILDQWFSWLTTRLNISPDLIVYLRTSPAVVLERMRQRCRNEERALPLSYLQDIHDLHEEWLVSGAAHAPSCPVMVLDADRSAVQVVQEFERKKTDFLSSSL